MKTMTLEMYLAGIEKISGYPIAPPQRQRLTERFELLCREIDEQLPSLLDSGAMDPPNKTSRAVFTDRTGIKLPAGQKATDAAIREYLGAGLVKHELEEARKEAEALEAANVARAKELETKGKRFLAAEIEIDTETFIELCKSSGLELHPRTIGSARKGLISLRRIPGSNQCQLQCRKGYGIDTLSDVIGQLFIATGTAIKDAEEVACPVAESLFKPGGTLSPNDFADLFQ